MKEHHYCHKQTLECNAETYLHKYAKQFIKHLFDSQEHLYIDYIGKSECCMKSSCQFKGFNYEFGHQDCSHNRLFKFDLKDYYDTCELEAEYKGFVADVLLKDSKRPDREPCFIEIAVTHYCEDEKINSGIRIIEISIPKETDDLDCLITLSDSNEEYYDRGNQKHISVRFFNFKNESISHKPLEIYSVPVFFVNDNGRGQVETHNRCCNFYGRGHLEDETSFEIHFSDKYVAYTAGVAIANLEGYTVKNCWVCKYHWYSHNYSSHHCNKDIPIVSPSNAQQCENYFFDKWKALSLKREANDEYQIIRPIEVPLV